MTGGIIQQVIRTADGVLVEVLCEKYFDRVWRSMDADNRLQPGVPIYWQSFTAYIDGEKAGSCRPGRKPTRAEILGAMGRGESHALIDKTQPISATDTDPSGRGSETAEVSDDE